MPAKNSTKFKKPKFPAIPVELALSLLWTHKEGKKDRVYTFSGSTCMMGCDVDVSDVEKDAKKHGILIAGPNMMRMGHGLAIVKPLLPPKDMRMVPVFYEHNPRKKAQINKLIADNS